MNWFITVKKKGLSFISNRHRRNEGTFSASELAGIEPTPPAPKGAGYVRLDHSATATCMNYPFGVLLWGCTFFYHHFQVFIFIISIQLPSPASHSLAAGSCNNKSLTPALARRFDRDWRVRLRHGLAGQGEHLDQQEGAHLPKSGSLQVFSLF
jgi:hypothetical protein